MGAITKEQKERAIEIAMDGESPLPYLKECGCANPSASWQHIRNCAVRDDPMKYEGKLPAVFGHKKKQKVELVYDESIAEEYRREQAEKKANKEARAVENVMEIVGETDDGILIAPKKEKKVVFKPTWDVDGYAATAIKKDGIGEFYFDKRSGTIDWRNEYGEEVSLLPEDWKRMAEEIPKMLKILGAEV